MSYPRIALVGLLALIAMSFGQSVALAAPIGTASGTYAFGPAGLATGSTVPFTGGVLTTTSLPLTMYPFGGAGSYSASPVTLNLAGYSTNPGPVTVVSPLVITEFNTGNTAVFTISGPGSLNALASSGTVDFGFSLSLFSNNTAIDFGTVGTLWRYIFSYQGLSITTGSPGSFTVVGGAQGTSSASFTLIRNDLLEGPLVPEPASVLCWGAIVGAGWLVRRRMKIAESNTNS